MATVHPIYERFGRVHAYLLDADDGLMVIDALGSRFAQTIIRELDRLGRRVDEISRIILTHGHLTHVKGAAALKRASGAQVYAPVLEQDVIEGRATSNYTTWIPRRPFVTLPQQYGLNLGTLLGRWGLRPGILSHPPVAVDVPIEHDEQRIGPLIAFHVPGHTPGHTAFYWAEAETIFLGDAVVTWPHFELGWRGLTEDYPLNVRSVQSLVARLEERGWSVHTLATGHGPPRRVEDGLRDLKRLLQSA